MIDHILNQGEVAAVFEMPQETAVLNRVQKIRVLDHKGTYVVLRNELDC